MTMVIEMASEWDRGISLWSPLRGEAKALRSTLSALKRASDSLPTRELCESVAAELQFFGGRDGDVAANISQAPGEDRLANSAKKICAKRKQPDPVAATKDVGRGKAEAAEGMGVKKSKKKTSKSV